MATRMCAAAFGALLVLGGCGGGGGSSSRGGTTSGLSYLPLDANDRWLYTRSANGTPAGSDLVSVAGTQTVAGQNATVLQTTDLATSSTSSSLITQQSDGYWQYPTSNADYQTQQFGPIELIRFPLIVGDSFVQFDKTIDSGVDLDGDGRTEPLAVHAVVSVVSLAETVTTAAGRFANCLHMNTAATETLQYTGGTRATANVSEDNWYAPDVGLVHRSLSVSTGAGLSVTSEDLTQYRTAKRASAPPTIQSVTPSAGSTRGATVSVTAMFNGPMDVASLNAGGLTIVDGASQPVLGSVQMSGNQAIFTPAQPWPSGTFTATVTTASQDLVGNAVAAARSWSFAVDATNPGVVSSIPASGAQDVPLTTPIVLLFSEPLDPVTVNASSVELRDESATLVSGTVALSSDGATVTFTPAAALTRRTYYTLYVSVSASITDLVGNPAVWSSLLFRTDQGRFASPVALAPNLTSAGAAIADLNGDGINDVVLTVTDNATQLAVMYGQSDGTLATPMLVPVGATGSSMSAIAIGDVNGDGLPDVVVGSDYLGMQVYLQAPDGSLAAGDYLNRAYGRVLRITDIDGDGKNELLVGSVISSLVDIWHQDAGGHLVLQHSLDFSAGGSGTNGLEVGDVNGDGRPDIVVTVASWLPGKNVAIFLQQPGGAFAPPLFLAADPTWGASGVAIGDVNGDGRADIVVGTGGNRPTTIGVYYQAANGTLGPMVPVATYDIPQTVRVADINGDGRADIVVSHEGWFAVGVYLQQPDGTLAPEVLYDAPYGSFGADRVVIGDVNRDGFPDIIYDGMMLRQKPVPLFGAAVRLPVRAGALGAAQWVVSPGSRSDGPP